MLGNEVQRLGESGAGPNLTCGVTLGTTEAGAGRKQGTTNSLVHIAEEIRFGCRSHAQRMLLGALPQLDKTDIRQRKRPKCSVGDAPTKRRNSRMKCD